MRILLTGAAGYIEAPTLYTLIAAGHTISDAKDAMWSRWIVENALRRVWAETLGGAAGPDDDFFACGGDSLTALSAAASLHRRLGVVLDSEWLYEVPRFTDALADLRTRAIAQRSRSAAEITAGPREGDHPLSFQQEGLLAWAGRFGDRHHHRLAYAAAVRAGSLDPGRLRAALAWLSQRHPAFRTRVHDARQHVADHRLELHTSRSASGSQLEATREWAGEPFADDGPLARVALIGGAEEDVVVLAAHQLVMDPWSWGLFLRELSARYAAPGDAAEPVLAYSDYARWQRRYLSGAVYAGHLEFWRALAAGHPAQGVPLPRAPASVASAGPASRLPVAVPAALATSLREIGQRLEASLFQVLLALFHKAVARWAGVRDVVVGSATANRTVPGTDRVIGFFVNGRFTRSQPDRYATFADLIIAVRDEWRAGDAHQELHLEKTVFDLGVPDLVNIKFSLDTIPSLDSLPTLGGQRLRPVEVATTASARRHLALSLKRVDDGLGGGLIYRTDVLTAQNAAGLLDHFEQVLHSAVTDLAGR